MKFQNRVDAILYIVMNSHYTIIQSLKNILLDKLKANLNKMNKFHEYHFNNKEYVNQFQVLLVKDRLMICKV